MNKHLLTMFVALLVASAALRASVPIAAQDSEQEETALQSSMDTLKKGQRGLRKLIAEPVEKRDEILALLVSMETAATTAMMERPPALATVPEAEQALWHVKYKQQMTRLLTSVLAMEEATILADKDVLKAAYDALGATKKGGHEEFRDQ